MGRGRTSRCSSTTCAWLRCLPACSADRVSHRLALCVLSWRSYYINLISRDWEPKKWDGNFQYEDKQTRSLMMLPTDIALIQDPKFKPWVELYARDQDRFFRDFANVFAKLISLGCPPECDPFRLPSRPTGRSAKSAEFREVGCVEQACAAKI